MRFIYCDLELRQSWRREEVDYLISALDHTRWRSSDGADVVPEDLGNYHLWSMALDALTERLRPGGGPIETPLQTQCVDCLVAGLSDPDAMRRERYALSLITTGLVTKASVREAVSALLTDPSDHVANNIRRQLAWHDMNTTQGTSEQSRNH